VIITILLELRWRLEPVEIATETLYGVEFAYDSQTGFINPSLGRGRRNER